MAELNPGDEASALAVIFAPSAYHPGATSFFITTFLDGENMPSHSSAGMDGRSAVVIRQMSCADIVLEIMRSTCSLPALSKYALVHPSWTPLAYRCMYRDLHLTSGEDIFVFFRCITAPTTSTKRLASCHRRCSLVRTLRITLAEHSRAARVESFHRGAFLDLFQILPQLVNMDRVMFEVHVLSKLIEYEWLARCATILPKSVKVFIINVRPISAQAVL